MSDPDNTALAGAGILITRPAEQAEKLGQWIRDAGGTPHCFPAIAILDPLDNRALLSVVDDLDHFDLAIFISANAVTKALNVIQARRGRLPEHLTLLCIGRQSAQTLARFGYPDSVLPSGRFDSEALLASAALVAPQGRRIVIFRGDGGRELLGNVLRERGAEVVYAECYRRARPAASVGPLLRLWARNEIHAVTFTSVDGLRNLFDMVGKLGQQWLIRTPAIVLGSRIEEAARELGWKGVLEVAPEASDEGLLAALKAWRARQKTL